MTTPAIASLGDLALRIRLGEGTPWRAVVCVNEGTPQEATQKLAEELTAITSTPVAIVDRPLGARQLDAAIAEIEASTSILVADFSSFGPGEWHHADLLRSRLERRAPLVLVMNP